MTASPIIPFPVDREVRHVEQTALALSNRHGAAADRFWQMTCRRLYARLEVQRVPDAAIRHELEAFSLAVQRAMQHQMTAASNDDYPRGAA